MYTIYMQDHPRSLSTTNKKKAQNIYTEGELILDQVVRQWTLTVNV